VIKLINIYQDPIADHTVSILWEHLAQRTPEQSISHKEMPTKIQHYQFVMSRPYEVWYLIEDGIGGPPHVVGNIYITKHREVGIHIAPDFRGKGIGGHALMMLRAEHPGRLLANINPLNRKSISFFKQHGARLLQHTFEL